MSFLLCVLRVLVTICISIHSLAVKGIRSGCKPGPVLLKTVTAIHLGCPLPNTSSGQPEERERRAASQPPRGLLFLFGLAPDGVCLLFTLETGKPDQVSFLWHCPCITAPGISPASYPVEPGLSSEPSEGQPSAESRDRPPGRILFLTI